MKFTIIPSELTPNLPETGNVSNLIKDNKKLLSKFAAYAKTLDNSVGLASNQVALDGERITERFCMVKTESKGWIMAINPKIISTFGKAKDVVEGCLTWGENVDIIASRFPKVKVEYFDVKGKKQTLMVQDSFESQVWQHEINHLNGVVDKYVPRIPRTDTIVRSEAKIGRNDPCACGSGKKYKKCCA